MLHLLCLLQNFQVTEAVILFLEDNSMMKQEVSFDLVVELGTPAQVWG